MQRKSTEMIKSKLLENKEDDDSEELKEIELKEEDFKSLEELEIFVNAIKETRNTITRSFTDEAISPTHLLERASLGMEIEKERIEYLNERNKIMKQLKSLIYKDRDDADENGTRGYDRDCITIEPSYHPIRMSEEELRKRGIEMLLTVQDVQEKKYGNCHEYAVLTLYKLYQKGFNGTAELFETPKHAFIIVNKHIDAKDHDVKSWGTKDKPCYVIDSWANRLIPIEKIGDELYNYEFSKGKSNATLKENYNLKAIEVAHKDLHYYAPKLTEKLLPENSLHPSRIIHTPSKEHFEQDKKRDNKPLRSR